MRLDWIRVGKSRMYELSLLEGSRDSHVLTIIATRSSFERNRVRHTYKINATRKRTSACSHTSTKMHLVTPAASTASRDRLKSPTKSYYWFAAREARASFRSRSGRLIQIVNHRARDSAGKSIVISPHVTIPGFTRAS